MFKKFELWVVILLLILFFISTIFYGVLLRHHYLSRQRFPIIQKIAVFFAEIPSHLKFIYTKNLLDFDMPPNLKKHKDKPRFKYFLNSNRKALLILPRYDGNLKRSIVEIINSNTFKVLHTYKHDVTAINNLIDTTKKGYERVKIDDAEIRFNTGIQ